MYLLQDLEFFTSIPLHPFDCIPPPINTTLKNRPLDHTSFIKTICCIIQLFNCIHFIFIQTI
ncbi:hypothetical protein HanRHA438_Chr03g0148261 [Helianthus annuus]|nr:hypothetical protein HanRHA438_Chr03g0148261 [Helianthus annuus]